jgi:hypothetical protein
MAQEFRDTGDGRVTWEPDSAGIEAEYCQTEKPVNLHRIPRPTGFTVSCFAR